MAFLLGYEKDLLKVDAMVERKGFLMVDLMVKRMANTKAKTLDLMMV